ncbi:translocation/assembly module TamB domain-containing protein, partial [Candidatus Marithioploca araucensis]|nr:translocation/assembly module TamB domain-containing protein [Candidatus Marithioploca araucensis]
TFADLGILPTLVSQVEYTQGEINMDMKLGGTMETPQMQGQIRVQNVATDLPKFGLEIKALNMKILAEKEEFTLQGSLKSGKGKLNLKGTAKLLSTTDLNWKANLNIAGKNFKVIDTADAWGIASPNINVKAVPDLVDVRGKITIPELAITPSKATSEAVTSSKDVVIVNPIEPEPEEKKGSQAIAISSHVTIILGDKVTFDGAGFTSRFGGKVIASNKPGKITVGNGELYIIKGRYNAYGQNLKIDRGRVFFSGGPIENPGLDIEAYRRIKRKGDDNVIAGVHIQGTAQSPKIVLYSKPPFDETNILSYIVLGKPAADASKGEGDILLNAAAALPLKYGDKLTKKMGKDLGLEAGISTEDGIEQAAFVLGKYLSPGLYVSYGIGLFDGKNVLRMRYELTKRLMLETETGTESGVDLRYTLER